MSIITIKCLICFDFCVIPRAFRYLLYVVVSCAGFAFLCPTRASGSPSWMDSCWSRLVSSSFQTCLSNHSSSWSLTHRRWWTLLFISGILPKTRNCFLSKVSLLRFSFSSLSRVGFSLYTAFPAGGFFFIPLPSVGDWILLFFLFYGKKEKK